MFKQHFDGLVNSCLCMLKSNNQDSNTVYQDQRDLHLPQNFDESKNIWRPNVFLPLSIQ